MNKKYYICVVLLIVSIILNVCGCDSREAEKAKESKRDQTEEEIEEEGVYVDVNVDIESIVLLSYKYSISEETIQQLIKDYDNNRDRTDKMNSIKEEAMDDYKIVLDKLSTQYNIPKKKLGSIIIDYRMFTITNDTQPVYIR